MASSQYDSEGRLLSVSGDDRSGSGVRSHLAAASMGTTAGKGLGSMGARGDDMPKQNPGEDAASYGERLRVYRAKKREKQESDSQKSAIRNLK